MGIWNYFNKAKEKAEEVQALLKKLRAIEDYARTYYLRIPLRPAEDWSGMPEPEETAPDNPGNPPLGGD